MGRRLGFTQILFSCVMVCTSIAAADAAVTWNSQSRFIRNGTEWVPTSFGLSQGATYSPAPLVASAPDFSPFSASSGGPYPSMGVTQNSTIGADTIDVSGYAYNVGQTLGLQYMQFPTAESFVQVVFTLDEPTAYEFDGLSTGFNAAGVQLTKGATTLTFSQINGQSYSGVLAAGQWTYKMHAKSQQASGILSTNSHFELIVPEPASLAMLIPLALFTQRRRLRHSTSLIAAAAKR
jgi:hypothetical protein